MQKNNAGKNLFKQITKVSRTQRETINNNRAFTLWFTGLSSSGKSTIAAEVEAQLFAKGYRTYILDGDNTRLGVNSDLSFSNKDRAENIRRVAEITKLFNDAGIIVIASFISPFANDRKSARSIVGEDSFIEVFIDSSLEVCKMRDPKGLYKKALAGEIKDFTGIDSPYEAPVSPDIHLHTDTTTPDDCVKTIIDWLNTNNSYQL
jgi:adenylyl-sulfate kinase